MLWKEPLVQYVDEVAHVPVQTIAECVEIANVRVELAMAPDYERIAAAMQKLDEVELIDEAFAEELEDVESDLTKTGLEKAGKNPGKAIGTML